MATSEKPRITKGLVDSLTPDPERDRVLWDRELAGFGVRVKPSGRKSYILQYRNAEGRSRRLPLGLHGVLTTASARKDARRHLADMTRGEDPAEERRRQRQGLTLRMLAERYLDEHRVPKRMPSTVKHFQQVLRAVILPKIGHRKAASLARRDIEQLHHSQARTPSQGNEQGIRAVQHAWRASNHLVKLHDLEERRRRLLPKLPAARVVEKRARRRYGLVRKVRWNLPERIVQKELPRLATKVGVKGLELVLPKKLVIPIKAAVKAVEMSRERSRGRGR